MKKSYRIIETIYQPHTVEYTFEAEDDKLIEILKDVGINPTPELIDEIQSSEIIELKSQAYDPVYQIAENWFDNGTDDVYVEADSWVDWKTDDGLFFIEMTGIEDADI